MIKDINNTKRLTAIEMVSTPKGGKIAAYWVFGIIVILIACLFLPWQQNIRASGKITSFKPQDRPQTIQATISGRVEFWYVQEGMYVRQGDTIARLSEIKDAYFDPEFLLRIKEQIVAKENSINFNKSKVISLTNQYNALKRSSGIKIAQAKNKLKQAQNKYNGDSADVVAAKNNYEIAKVQLERQQILYDQGLKSKTEFEQRQQKFQETFSKFISSENKLLVSFNDIINARMDFNGIEAEYQDKISKTESEINSSQGYISDAEGELSKLTNYFSNMSIRAGFYYIRAPQDGYVVKAIKTGLGEIIKESDPIVTIMPSNPQLAIELYVKAMDMPLLNIGNEVRVQFDGWPAIQFAGWPNLSVGTFGGKIAVMDYIESEKSTYRILIIQDNESESWPTMLRVGSGAQGWAMLKEVPVWYELWRQLNGFPADLINATDSKSKDKLKDAK